MEAAHLPDELWVLVLRFLDLRDVLALRLVSHAWYSLARDQEGWKAMYITRYYFDKEGRTVNGFPFKHEGGRWEELFMRYSTTKKVWHPNNAAQMGVQHFQGSKQQRCLTIQGDYLVSGGNSMTVDFWRLDDCTLEWSLEGHEKAVMAIQADSEKIVSGSDDGTMILWSWETGEMKHHFKGHLSWVLTLQYDDRRIITGGGDGKVMLWDLQTGALTGELTPTKEKGSRAHESWATKIQFDPEKVISVNYNGGDAIKIWDPRCSDPLQHNITTRTQNIWGMHYNDSLLIVGGTDLSSYDIRTLELISVAPAVKDVHDLHFDDELLVYAAGKYTCVASLDFGVPKLLHSIEVHDGMIWKILHTENYIGSASFDEKLSLIEYA